jgi:outer membrane protein assembly factor BamE (lipoprotein component of BamABCDE complex)
MKRDSSAMKKHFKPGRWLMLLTAATLALSSCQGHRLTKANVDEITDGMTRKQVESILGPPTSVDSTNLLVTKKVTYTYKQGDGTVTIVFFNDQVSSKDSNLQE